jgi:hypothetical protein
MPRIGALLFVAGGEARFVPAADAVRVAVTPPVTRVPGGPPELMGIALHDGVVVPVLSVGPARGDMVLCNCAGELVAFVGAEAFETGVFETDGDTIEVLVHEGRRFSALDLPALCTTVERAALRDPWSG